jgi:hypothetical protein
VRYLLLFVPAASIGHLESLVLTHNKISELRVSCS